MRLRGLDTITTRKPPAQGRTVKAFNPVARPDSQLFVALLSGSTRGAVTAFANRDLRAKLTGHLHKDPKQQSAQISRLLHRLHIYRLVAKHVTDALGRVFTDAANLRMEGDIATFDSDYYDYLNRCLKAASDLVNKKARWKVKGRPGEPQEHFQNVLDIMVQQIREGDREAAALIPGMMSVYGVGAVNRALAGKVVPG